ncbi:hypothetical protein TRVL_07474 [Trypanosoma vivax]|nr:hypothetical protein TRVL_07474 [Trypanosoma vivax]
MPAFPLLFYVSPTLFRGFLHLFLKLPCQCSIWLLHSHPVERLPLLHLLRLLHLRKNARNTRFVPPSVLFHSHHFPSLSSLSVSSSSPLPFLLTSASLALFIVLSCRSPYQLYTFPV